MQIGRSVCVCVPSGEAVFNTMGRQPGPGGSDGVVRCLTSLAIADPARVLSREYHCHFSIAEDFSDSSLPWRLKRRTVTSPLVAIMIALGAVDGKRCGPKRWYHSIASAEPGRPSRETKRRLILHPQLTENPT
jgi:hypothetical protein